MIQSEVPAILVGWQWSTEAPKIGLICLEK